VGIVALFIFAITLVTERNFILIRRGLENLSSKLTNYCYNTSVAFEKIAGARSEIFIKWIFLFFSLLSFFLMPAILLSIALAWPAVRVIFARDLEKSLQTSLLLYTIAYCGTQTAGYNPSSMEPLIVLLFCETWPAIISEKKNNITFRAAIFCFFVFSFGIQLRTKILEHGYSWWGLKTAGLFSGNQSLPTEYLKGVSTDGQTFKMVSAAITAAADLAPDEKVFAYPSIPIIYSALGKLAPTNGVLWFDAASESDGTRAVSVVSALAPKYIFWLRPPNFVYEGHLSLRGRAAAMNVVDAWILEELRKGTYVVEKSIVSYSSKIGQIDLKSQTKAEINLAFAQIGRLKLDFYTEKAEIIKKGWRPSDDIVDLKFQNLYVAQEFLTNTPLLIDLEEYVFYVLRRTENN
jgi:hypothetical protein